MRNILVIFLVSGLWHGANWTFLAWGGIHGSLYLLEFWASKQPRLIILARKAPSWLKILVVFNLVTVSWIFFRADSVTNALQYLTLMATAWPDLGQVTNPVTDISRQIAVFGDIIGLGKNELIIAALASLVVIATEFKREDARRPIDLWFKFGPYGRLITTTIILWLSIFVGHYSDTDAFIYFQF
tara:strand:- start:56 stop:610 length:555 start_codon:yes stop_codon:yes gene_type:complete